VRAWHRLSKLKLTESFCQLAAFFFSIPSIDDAWESLIKQQAYHLDDWFFFLLIAYQRANHLKLLYLKSKLSAAKRFGSSKVVY